MEIYVNQIRLHYQMAGQGLPLLFIHGFPLNGSIWAPQLEDLQEVAQVIAPDLRGHGDSQPAAGVYSMDTLADECLGLLDGLGVRQPAVICGLSMGGYVAFAFYRKYAERAAALILAATRAGADSPEGKAGREKSASQAREQGPSTIFEAMLPKMLAPATYQEKPELVAEVEAIMASTSLEGVVGDLLGMRDRPDSTPILAKIKVPTLILHGTDDQILPLSEAEAMHAAIPASRLVALPACGHLLNLERPDLFNQAVREFTSQL